MGIHDLINRGELDAPNPKYDPEIHAQWQMNIWMAFLAGLFLGAGFVAILRTGF